MAATAAVTHLGVALARREVDHTGPAPLHVVPVQIPRVRIALTAFDLLDRYAEREGFELCGPSWHERPGGWPYKRVRLPESGSNPGATVPSNRGECRRCA